MINFALFGQPTRTGDKITIYLRVNCDSQKVRISTKISVPPKNWNQAAQSVVKGGDFDLAFYREKLTKIVNSVENIVRTANLEEWDLEQVQKEILKSLGKDPGTSRTNGVLALYKEWATVGTATKKFPRASDRLTYNVFNEYIKGVDIPFNKVDYALYNDFMKFLRIKKKYKENSVGNHIRNLKAVMNEGLKRRLHNNLDFKNFNRPSEEITNINLTEKELQKLRSCKVKGLQEQVRDVFVLGCYVAQRHSDYSRLSYKDIKDGFVFIQQVKTDHKIKIPLHPIAKEILDKYNGELPDIPIQVLNKNIKDVAYLAKIDDEVLIRGTKAGQKSEKYVKKWSLITSHVARKSGVTNALRAGVPIEDCMYLAGIKSLSTFKKYAGVTDDEYSARLAGNKFFSGSEETEELIAYATKIIRSGAEPFWLERLKGAYRNSLKKD